MEKEHNKTMMPWFEATLFYLDELTEEATQSPKEHKFLLQPVEKKTSFHNSKSGKSNNLFRVDL